MSTTIEQIQAELAQIQEQHGTLRAEDVVEFARNTRTALHAEFQWDDTEAAKQYRLSQARKIIRINVQVLPTARGNVTVPVYVSLSSDRIQPGGGYRRLEDVMNDADLRQQFLDQALAEFERVRRKYQNLQELAPIFAAIERVAQQRARQPVAN
jgi:hypothetical protein